MRKDLVDIACYVSWMDSQTRQRYSRAFSDLREARAEHLRMKATPGYAEVELSGVPRDDALIW